jgi:eukaryotic-like serine/threonine-protein kinase
VLGTSGYLSPEQARGEPADPRSDVFAIGAVVYELVTGRRAFDGATFAERLSAVLRDAPADVDHATFGELAPVIARCLDKDPRRRFQAAADLAWVLDGHVPRPAADAVADAAAAPPSRRAVVLGAVAAGVGGLAVGRWLGGRRPGRVDRPLVYQQLTHRRGRVASARATRDAGTIVYGAAWDGAPLALFITRVGGGGTRALDLPGGDVLAISARGELALSFDRRYVEGFHQSGQLAIAPLEGGVPRIVADDVQHADFTPDGALAIVRRGGTGFVLELAGRTLLDVGGWLSHPRVSPDGGRVACLVHPSPYDDRGDLVVVDRGGRSRVVSAGWTSANGLAWDPGGRRIWLTATRAGAGTALRTIDLDGGDAVVAQTTGRLRLHDLGSDRGALVTDDVWRLRLMVRAPGAASDVDLSRSDISVAGDLSRDGRTVAFGDFGDVDPLSGTYLRPTDGGPALRLGDGLPLALSADGARVVASMLGAAARLVIHDVRGGTTPVATASVEGITWARWRGDAQLIVGGAEPGRASRVWLVDLGGGAPTPVTGEGTGGPGHVSPDGARVAVIAADGRLRLVAIDAPAEVVDVPGDHRGAVVCGWSGDGAVWVRDHNLPLGIRRVDVGTGAVEPVGAIAPPPLGLKGVDAFAMAADGDAYAYSYGEELSRLYRVVPG